MRVHLGPPRELRVRRREGARHRAVRILWSVVAIVLGGLGLMLVAAPAAQGSQGSGARVAKIIVAAAASAIGVLELKAPPKGGLMLTIVLAWTVMMAVVVWR